MLKRTKGYVLLTMLVLTGLAGRVHTDTITGKERRFLLHEMKQTKAFFTESIEGLSTKQLDFSAIKGKPTIRQYIFQAATTEHTFWESAKMALQQPGVVDHAQQPDDKLFHVVPQEIFENKAEKAHYKNVEQALFQFKNERADQLKYIRTTTENVRIHIAQTPLGILDAYQMMLLNTICLRQITAQIEKTKSNTRFPK